MTRLMLGAGTWAAPLTVMAAGQVIVGGIVSLTVTTWLQADGLILQPDLRGAAINDALADALGAK